MPISYLLQIPQLSCSNRDGYLRTHKVSLHTPSTASQIAVDSGEAVRGTERERERERERQRDRERQKERERERERERRSLKEKTERARERDTGGFFGGVFCRWKGEKGLQGVKKMAAMTLTHTHHPGPQKCQCKDDCAYALSGTLPMRGSTLDFLLCTGKVM